MKRTLILCLVIFGLLLSATAHPVDLQTAQSIASKFMGTNDLRLVYTYSTDKNIAAFYVFNTHDGFVIVAADDCETPIIAYSHEGRFDPNNVPMQMEGYLHDFVSKIQYGIENHIEADVTTSKQWELVKTMGRLNDHKSTKAVAPLLTEKWHQGCLYNSLCPTMSGPCDHAEVGCVAVAMGQIMHYWRYPSTGWGSQSYTNSGIAVSADFGSTTYDWDHMPDSLTENATEAEIEAVATLLYHCGVSVKMYYTTNGSGASSSDVPNALYRYFSYSKQAHREQRSDYDDETWLSMLKHDLDLQRPVIYSGSGDQGAHAFVCDGYDDNNLLHFNWGWGVANGYFALGNLNPIGCSFNNNNYAVLDIIPQYDPCVVTATAIPSSAGSIEGTGEYHIGARCTLTATPSEDYEFYYWKKNGQVISNLPSVTITVDEDVIDIEAHFSLYPVSQIAATYTPDTGNPNSPNVNLSWSYLDTNWPLLKQFEIEGEPGGVATDGEYIYTTFAVWNDPPFMFGKYTMNGELVELFNVEGIPDALCLAYDGTSFYCNSMKASYSLSILYRVDLDSKTVIESTDTGDWFGSLAYDPEYDGFWLGTDYRIQLFDRQGQRLITSPTTQDYINGGGHFIAQDGTSHLLLSRESGVYDYDINNNIIYDRPLLTVEYESLGFGACTAKYNDKDAMFVVVGNTIQIYEIKNTLAQIVSYRIYRADSEGQAILLADDVAGSSFTDETWENAIAGLYRFGISSVYANGVESEILWSDFIEKTDYGIGEDLNDMISPSVRKVFENGHIIIIKDGKRYNVWGQELN